MTQPDAGQPVDPSADLVLEIIGKKYSVWQYLAQFLRMAFMGGVPSYSEGDIKKVYKQASPEVRTSDMKSFEAQAKYFERELAGLTGMSNVAAVLISLLLTVLALALGQGRGPTLLWVLGGAICVGLSVLLLIRMTMHRIRVLWTRFYHPLRRARIRRDEEGEYLFLFDKEWRLLWTVDFLKSCNVLSGALAGLGMVQLLVYLVLQASSLM